jgi:hypothetical protein
MKTKLSLPASKSQLNRTRMVASPSGARLTTAKTTSVPLEEDIPRTAAPTQSLPPVLGSLSSDQELIRELLADKEVVARLIPVMLNSENSERMLTTGPTEADWREALTTILA